MKELEKIYYNFSKLCDNYSDLPETEEAREKLLEIIGEEKALEWEEYISIVSATNEKQGFMYGFRYAVSLLMNGNMSQL